MAAAILKPTQRAEFPEMDVLPSALDVEKFALTRQYEIKHLKHEMAVQRSKASTRAFQSLPRHLRRRAASHNPRHVPGRLRAKATDEIDDKTKPKKHYPKHKLTLKSGLTRTKLLKRRQRSNIWLPTHIYHAKRCHMIRRWGFALAWTPTAKSFRPSHRAARHASILRDTSAESTFEITGTIEGVKNVLKSVCGTGVGPWNSRYTSGLREASTLIYTPHQYPHSLIGPAKILWSPQPPPPSAPSLTRKLWIRVHPSIASLVFAALATSISALLSQKKWADEEISLQDIRSQLSSFQIVGPRASQVLAGALAQVANSSKEVHAFFLSLRSLGSPGELPQGMVVSGHIHDPRLSFPPTNAKVTESYCGNNVELQKGLLDAADKGLWEWEERTKGKSFRKIELDRRREENGIPGQRLKPTSLDDRPPFILIQHTISQPSSSSPASSSTMHGYTLILPSSFSQPILPSLLHTGTRLSGLRESESQAFECGTLAFPKDFSTTEAGRKEWDRKEDECRARWEKRPPAKRPNWEKLKVESAWKPDWKGACEKAAAVSLPNPLRGSSSYQPAGNSSNMDVDTGRPTLDEDEEMISINTVRTGVSPFIKPWTLKPTSSSLSNFFSSLLGSSPSDQPLALLAHINSFRLSRNYPYLLSTSEAQALWNGCLIDVEVDWVGRGSAGRWKDEGGVGLLYEVDESEVVKGLIEKGAEDDFEVEEADKTLPLLPPASSVIGYLTSLSFSLSRGHTYGIGAIPLSTFMRIVKTERARNGGGGARCEFGYVGVRACQSRLIRVGRVKAICSS